MILRSITGSFLIKMVNIPLDTFRFAKGNFTHPFIHYLIPSQWEKRLLIEEITNDFDKNHKLNTFEIQTKY